jgi:hypothetical protein
VLECKRPILVVPKMALVTTCSILVLEVFLKKRGVVVHLLNIASRFENDNIKY